MDVPVSEGDNVVSNGDTSIRGGPLPPPSPLTGCYLLIVVGEPYSEEHKEIILQRIAKGLLSWDMENCHVDLEKELQAITDVAPEGEEARHGERLIQFATENLVTEVLIHPAANTLIQCMKNLLSSFTRHRHIIHSGYTFGGNGSWALQDGTFSLADFTEAFQENDVQRVIKAYENTITIDIHCSSEGDWTRLPKESYTKTCKVQVNPNDVLTSGSSSINGFLNYLSPFLLPADIESLLESSDVVGNIRFSHPTLYVFPGGQGDAALFGINGFNMLVDGGYARKACFWDFTRHLDRLDAVLVTRLNNSNVCGVSSVLKRKTNNQVYPQIGHFFCNLQERKAISPDGDKDRDPLLINLLDEGQDIISNLRQLNLRPQLCYRDTDPINLYHKVGHGTLDMYVLSPAKDSKEVKEFLHKWNTNDQRLFTTRKDPKEFSFPLSNLVSICALLVWKPANPSDTITRLLFPGSTPQHKIFEGLDRLKHLEFMKHPVCSAKSLTPSGSILGLTKSKQTKTTTVLDKILPSEQRTQKILDMKPLKERTPPQNENKQKVESKNENKKLIEMNGTASEENKISKTEKVIKSNSVESDKSEPGSDTKKTELMNGKDVEIILEDKSDPKPKTKVTESKPRQRISSKARSESSTRRSIEKKPKVERKVESKPSPPTPKKTVDAKVNGVVKEKDVPKPKLLNRIGLKSSPTSTPAKSTKDATNRKVVESKYRPAPKKEPIAKKEPAKVYERKPISRRPKAASPVRASKTPASPSKKLPGVKTDKNGVSRTIKLDKEGTTDSSAVSTPSADQDTSKKIDESKLTKTELEELKAKELADLKEEQEVVKEIEAVFRKDEKLNESDQPDLRKIKDVSIEEKTTEADDEEEEYLIVEKEEVEQNTDSVNEQESATKEDEIQKHQRDSEESEKPRKGSDAEKSEKKVPIVEEVPAKIEPEIQETKLIEAETCKVLEIVQPPVKEVEEIIIPTAEMTRSKEDSREKTEEMSKEISVTSPEDKIDISSEKKLTDTRGDVEEEENKEEKDQNYVLESQPDEKFSATIESGATTAPTLPEDERITLDEIKEDQVIEEKYVKEETKEEKEIPAVVITQKPLEAITKISPTVGIIFQAHQSHIRDIVKTPDEVADLPVHEEVDIDTYDFPSAFKKDNKKIEPPAQKEQDESAKPVDKNEVKIDAVKVETDEIVIDEIKTAVEEIPEIQAQEVLHKEDKEDEKDREDLINDVTTDTKVAVVIEQSSEKAEEVLQEAQLEIKEIETIDIKVEKEPQETKQDPIQTVTSVEETKATEEDIKLESTEIKGEVDEKDQAINVAEDKSTKLKEIEQDTRDEVSQQVEAEEDGANVEKDDIEEVKEENIDISIPTEIKEKVGEIMTTIKDAIAEITSTSIKTEYVLGELKKGESEAATVAATEELDSAEKIDNSEEIINETISEALEENVLKTEDKQEDSDKNAVICDAKEIVIDIIEEAERKTSVVEVIVIEHPYTEAPDANFDTEPRIIEPKTINIEVFSHPYKEDEIVKIVSSVAHVLKSDAPLEELAATLPMEYGSPFKSFGLKGYTTELRETHITTLDSPVQEDAALPGKDIYRESFSVCPKQSSVEFIDEEKKIAIEDSITNETQEKDISPQEKKISDLIKDSNALIASTSKIISEIKSAPVVDCVITEEEHETEEITEMSDKHEETKEWSGTSEEAKKLSDKPEEDSNDIEALDETDDTLTKTTGTVHRMLVTASSEDGGEETVICPTGSITFTKEDSGKSSPEKTLSTKSTPREGLSARSTPEPTEKESIVDSKDEAQIQDSKNEEIIVRKDSTVEETSKEQEVSEKRDDKIEKDTKETETKTKEEDDTEDIVSSGISSPKLPDHKTSFSDKSTPDIKIAEQTADKIDAKQEEDIKFEEKISRDDHETENTDKDMIEKDIKAGIDESKASDETGNAENSNMKIDVIQEKQLITDRASPDIKDEISDTSTKEDVETVKELSPMTTEHVELKQDEKEIIKKDSGKTEPDEIEECIVSKETATITKTSADPSSISVELDKEEDESAKIEPELQGEIESSKLKADVKEDVEQVEDLIYTIAKEIKSDEAKTETEIKDEIVDSEKQVDIDLKEEKEISEKIQNELEEQQKQTDAEVKIDTITKQKTDDIYEEKESTETLSEMKAQDVTDVTEVAEGLKDTSTAPHENEVQTGKSTPDFKEKSGKSTPESKVDTKESSGKATPDLKQDSLSASAFPASTSESAVTLDKPIPDLKSELKEDVSSIAKSGKSSPDLLISRTSTPDIKADLTSTELSSLTVETKERPGKSTPELNEDGKDAPEILADNGLKVEEKHGSGKSTPELKTTKEDTGIFSSVHLSEIKTDDTQSSSGKSSPKPESDIKEHIHQPEASPEIKDGKAEILKIESLETGAEEIIEEVTEVVSIEETTGTKEQKQSSGKASPAFESQDKDSESKESISEITLQEQAQLDPHENNIGDGDSGKSSPDLKCDRSKSIFSVTSEKSGKSTPNINEDHITPIATPEIHDIKDVSGKSTPDIKLAERKSIISITSQQSGQSTPDLKPDDLPSGLTLDVHENKDLSGRSTPEIKIDLSCDQSGKSSPDLQEHISDIQDIIADVAPDMKPDDRKSIASITSEHSGKSTSDLKAEHTSPISSPNIHDIKADSGKSTPDIKPDERKSIISLTSEQSGKSTPRDHVSPRSTPDISDTKAESDIATTEKSGPLTPEVKASAPEVHDTKPESRKSTPDIKNEIEKSLNSETTETSGKSTPDITATTPEVNDIKNKSGKSTPDIKQDIRKSLSSETTEKAGKATPDSTATTPEVHDIKTESGKSTPDIKHEIRKSLTSETTEKSGKSTPDIIATTPEVNDIKHESGKSTPDIKQDIGKSLSSEITEKSGKATPDSTATTPEVRDIKNESGKSTPDIKHEIRKSLTSETNENSGKSTPDITTTTHEVHDIKSESGKSTPDIKDEIRKSLTSETNEKSGKSTPDITATTHEVHDIKSESGKSTPDIKDEIRKSLTSETTEKSGKSIPDIKATTPEVHDIINESGISTPDMKNEIRKSITSEQIEKSGKSTPDITATTPEVHDIKNESGKSTSDIEHEIRKSLTSETAEKSRTDMTATTPEVCDIKDESIKSTPDIKTELSKSGVSVTSEESGTSTPDIKATTSEIHDTKSESGKSTPDIKSETRMSIASVSSEKSGKSTPDIKDTAPDIHDIKSESEEVSSDIKCVVSETVTSITSEKSGKSSPDIKGTTPEVHDVKSESGKFSPDIKCETSNVVSVTSEKSENSIPDIKATTLDVNDIKINSGKSTPDLTEEVDKSVISIISQPSGKSTPEIKATTPDILDTKRESGKTTPDAKCEITESVALVTSGKSTPEIKATTPDILDTKGESGKTTPDVKREITESGALVTSGKSTPEIKATSLDIKLESGKSTPDVKCDINETAFVTSETSGKSTPDIKSPKPEICDVIDDSGKATPDIKCDVRETAVSVTNAKSGKSTPDIKEPTSHEIKSESRNSTPDIKQEIVENITSLTNAESGKLTPDLKGASGKSTPDIKCELRKSIISITSDISGKSTPDFKDNDVSAHETLDKSGKSTPDLKCEVNTIVASVTSDQSGKSTPEPVRSTPDIYDVYGKSTPDEKCGMRKTMVSITSDQSGKSTPDLKNNTTSAEVHDLDQSGISTPNMETEEQPSIVSINSKQPDIYTPDLKDESESATPEQPISNDIKELSEKSTPDVQKNDLTKLETTVVINVKTDLKIIVPTEKDIKESQPNVITTELSVAGPSNLLREDSISSSGQISPSNKDIIHLSSEELHLSGKSTPDIADVERMKEIHEILKHEKHIPGSSTPPTVPVSPIVKETFTLQTEEQKLTEKKELSSVEEKEQVDEKETDTTSITEITETVKQSGITTTSTSTTVTKKVVDDLQLIKDTTEVAPTTKDGSSEIAQKSTDLRCSTPGSDDCDFGGVSSPHSDISSGQMSRVAHAWGHGSSEERQAYSDDDDDVPGSPTSVTSQMTHSPSARYTEFEVGSEKSTKIDPMISSFYGALPDDSAEESSVTSSESKVQSQPIPITTTSHLEYSTTKETEKRFLEDTDLDFEKAMLEHRQTRGTDLISGSASDSPNYKYEITQAKYSKVIKETSMENGKDGIPMKEIAKNGFDKDSEIEQKIKTDSPKKSSPEIMTSSFIEASSSNSQQQDIKKDPIETWGKPLGLPSPALPPTSDMSNKTTPKKMPPSATLAAKNKINDERKRSESPSKYKKNKNNSPVYLDLTYVPHHGNSYYSFVEFFKRVRARYYVFSGTEPSRDVYNALLEAKQTWEDKELEVTIIPTYDTDVLGYWVAENEDLLAKYKIDLSPSASRCTINLQDHETSCSAYRLEF